MLKSCRPERRHILFRPRSLMLRGVRGRNRDIASVTDLCARRPCFRAGRGRLACCHQRRPLFRFYLRRRGQRAGARPSAFGRRADRAGAKGLARLQPLSSPEAERVAQRLCDASFADVVFFCNSGAEAMECTIKTARKYQSANGAPERYRIITFEGAFHGRTLATLAAGGQKKYLDGFGPVVEGFDQVPFGDLEATKAAVTPETAAILIEPIMGEGGVRVVEPSFLRALRELCDKMACCSCSTKCRPAWAAPANCSPISASASNPISWRWPRRSAAASRSARAWQR